MCSEDRSVRARQRVAEMSRKLGPVAIEHRPGETATGNNPYILSMRADLDFLDHLVRESSWFGMAMRDVPSDQPVPTCPGWGADDLVWHLGVVQWFWAAIIRERVIDPPPGPPPGPGERPLRRQRPSRPGNHAGLLTFYENAGRDLVELLGSTSPDALAWSWSSDQSVGFILRRQTHEALIHRIDAELTAGRRGPVDPVLGADGADEVLRVMRGARPGWGRITAPDDDAVRLIAVDTEDSWVVAPGRLTGTDPDSGDPVDRPYLAVLDIDTGLRTAATVRAAAADLDCWLWRRPAAGELELRGDQGVLSRLESAIAAEIK
jgi:uncharacterized protein (TIGR03083 family)